MPSRVFLQQGLFQVERESSPVGIRKLFDLNLAYDKPHYLNGFPTAEDMARNVKSKVVKWHPDNQVRKI